MKYLILIYHNPKVREAWEGMSAEQRAAGMQVYQSFMEDLTDSGELVVAEALADPTQAKRVSTGDGRTSTTDGPFPELKEHLAGFYLVDVSGEQRAVELAARIPESQFGVIEVRPVLSLAGADI